MALELQRRQTMLNMSMSSSRGGISRMMSSQGASSPASTLVQSSMRTSCASICDISHSCKP